MNIYTKDGRTLKMKMGGVLRAKEDSGGEV